MWQLQWSIDVYAGPALDRLAPLRSGSRPALTIANVTDLPARAVADPFLLVHRGEWFLFFEVVNADSKRGEIAYATSADAGLTWTYRARVLAEPWHLSYPHVFEAGGVIYMVPESRRADGIYLYAAEEFPARWRRVALLQRGPFADPTITFHDGRWWLFAQRGLDELRLYVSDSLTDGWTEHPASPLWPGNRSRTRPGGRILRRGDRLVRFAQDGWPVYGHSLRAFDITVLNDTSYEEEEWAGSPILRASRHGWNAVGMHHLDAIERADGSWIAVVDGASPVLHRS